MGKGGKGQPAHSRAFSAHATGASWFSPRSGLLDLAGFQSAINSHWLSNRGQNGLDCPGMREALLEINKGGNFGGSGEAPFIGDVGMGMLDGRGVSPEQAAAIFRVYDTAQSGQLTYEQFANVFRLMSAPERTDELRLLERKVFLEKMFAAEPTHFALENPGFNAVCCATCVSEVPLFCFGLPPPMVCFWPHGIIFFGSPCAMAAKLCWAPRANAATTVRLTPNAVVSVTEPYAGWSACMGPPIVAPCNCCLVCMGGDPMCTAYKNDRQVVDVVPLEFVDAVDVLRPVYPGGLERLVVSAYGGSHMIAKDGATNAKAFADAVMQQKASAARLDFNERAALQNFLASSWFRLDLVRHGRSADLGEGRVVGDVGAPMQQMMMARGGPTAPGFQPVAAVTAVHPAPAMISVAVPEGAVAGTVIQVQAPSGAIQVAVPEGVKPGQVIQVAV
ncbi:hypothetical protein JL722_11442 [Aureococcus anophagefferens]|nr:hypothetical protein JL722_11442 [Aureococcus anophagefferens]